MRVVQRFAHATAALMLVAAMVIATRLVWAADVAAVPTLERWEPQPLKIRDLRCQEGLIFLESDTGQLLLGVYQPAPDQELFAWYLFSGPPTPRYALWDATVMRVGNEPPHLLFAYVQAERPDAITAVEMDLTPGLPLTAAKDIEALRGGQPIISVACVDGASVPSVVFTEQLEPFESDQTRVDMNQLVLARRMNRFESEPWSRCPVTYLHGKVTDLQAATNTNLLAIACRQDWWRQQGGFGYCTTSLVLAAPDGSSPGYDQLFTGLYLPNARLLLDGSAVVVCQPSSFGLLEFKVDASEDHWWPRLQVLAGDSPRYYEANLCASFGKPGYYCALLRHQPIEGCLGQPDRLAGVWFRGSNTEAGAGTASLALPLDVECSTDEFGLLNLSNYTFLLRVESDEAGLDHLELQGVNHPKPWTARLF